MRRMVMMVAAALATAGVAGAAALNGGSDIASAPVVVPGQQETGNTATEGKYFNNPASFWKLSLVAGDRVTVDWENTGDGTFVTEFHVFPPGTTDFNINNAHSYAGGEIGSNGKQESSFTANATGVFPMVFLCYCD